MLSNIQNVKTPLRKCKAPYWKLSGDGSGLNITSFARRFRCVRFLAAWKSNKHAEANREPSGCNHLAAFTWRILLVCAGADTGGDAGDASLPPDLKRYYHGTWFHCKLLQKCFCTVHYLNAKDAKN